MTTSTQTSRALSQHTFVANTTSDAPAGTGPWPGMSARAALIARSLVVATLLGWVAMTESRLLVVLAFAVPFWIAIELELRASRSAARAVGARTSSLLYFPDRRERPSNGPRHSSPPRAA